MLFRKMTNCAADGSQRLSETKAVFLLSEAIHVCAVHTSLPKTTSPSVGQKYCLKAKAVDVRA